MSERAKNAMPTIVAMLLALVVAWVFVVVLIVKQSVFFESQDKFRRKQIKELGTNQKIIAEEVQGLNEHLDIVKPVEDPE